MIFFALALALSAAGQPIADDLELTTFTAASSREAESVRIRVGVMPNMSGALWFEREAIPRGGSASTYAWATEQSCPRARQTYDRLDRIDMPTLTNPRNDGSIVVIADGTWYTLETAAFYGVEGQTSQVRLESNINTPLAIWVEAMLTTLRGCWSPNRPAVD